MTYITFFAVKVVKDGIFRAELNELLTRELAENGYSGVEVRPTISKTIIVIRATKTQEVLGKDERYYARHLLFSGPEGENVLELSHVAAAETYRHSGCEVSARS